MDGRKPRRDDLFECTIDGADRRGRRTAAWGEYRVKLDRGAPGASVAARVLKRRGNRIEARVDDVLGPSAEDAVPRCAHAASCGGCSFQDVRYEAQLALLASIAEEALAPLVQAGAAFELEPVIPCEEPWAYRNKMDFTFSNRRWIEEGEPEGAPRDFALGLHVPGRFDKVLDVGRCEIQFPEGNELLTSARELARELGLEPWDARNHTGLLRHLVLRKGVNTGELLAFVVVSSLSPEVERYAERLLERHPELTTLVLGENARHAGVAVADEERVVHGPGFIRERLAGLVFEISPSSFFQTNTLQAERLVEMVREEAGNCTDATVLDLFCGAGTLGLALAGGAREIVGIEREPSAVRDAERNATANGISNARFLAAEVERVELAEAMGSAGTPDLVVVDPPRAGLHPKAAGALLGLAPARLVYVSCNPESAARDLAPFVTAGYSVVRARPIDLFPHTPHVELVLSLVRGPAT